MSGVSGEGTTDVLRALRDRIDAKRLRERDTSSEQDAMATLTHRHARGSWSRSAPPFWWTAKQGCGRIGWKALAADVARLRARGVDVILVSSGSIALGRAALGLPATALTLEQSQAAAAVGQIRLAHAYEEALAPNTGSPRRRCC
jgi:hypothetical protein